MHLSRSKAMIEGARQIIERSQNRRQAARWLGPAYAAYDTPELLVAPSGNQIASATGLW